MSATSAPILKGDRFAPVTPDNHSGSIWIATLLCLVYTVITLMTRGFLRKLMYGIDDFLIFGSALFHLAEALAVIVGLKHGLGKTLSLLQTDQVATASKAAFAAQILYIASAGLAKCSTIWLMMRLFNLNGPKSQNHGKSKLYKMACFGAMGFVAFWTVGSMIGLGVDCSTANFIRTPALAKCPDQYVRWQVITAIDIITEGVMLIMVAVIVAPVHLSLYIKSQVVLAFLFRLPLIGLSALRLHYVRVYTHSSNAGIAQEAILIIQQAYLCWSIISATIPNLKSFVRSFGSGFGIGVDMERYTNAYGSKGSYGNKYELGSVGNTKASKMGSRHTTRQDNRSYNDFEDQNTAMTMRQQPPRTPQHQEQDSIESSGSQERIIRKDVGWKIHYENGRA